MSKGSKPRPIVNRKTFESNWDAIFNNQPKEEPEETEEQDTASSPEGYCIACCGSGEGRWEGTTCTSCRGTGHQLLYLF